MSNDIYGWDRILENAKASVVNNFHNAEDRHAVLEFVRFLEVQSVTKARQTKYIRNLATVSEALGISFSKALRSDWQRCFETLDSKEYSPHTLQDFRVLSKRFLNWLYKLPSKQYPEQIAWVSTNLDALLRKKGRQSSKYGDEDIITDEEFKRVVNASGNLRDKLAVYLLRNLGVSISELMGLRIQDIKLEGNIYAVFIQGTKTKYRNRVLPLIDVNARKALQDWLAAHPNANKPGFSASLLLVSNAGKPIGYRAIKVVLERLHKRAGVNKPPNPHLYRHTAASNIGHTSGISYADLCRFFGWSKSSNMPNNYVHDDRKKLFETFERALGDKETIIASLQDKAHQLETIANSDENVANLKRALWLAQCPELMQETLELAKKAEEMGLLPSFGTDANKNYAEGET